MSGSEILLLIVVILIPLVIAVVVTLWTLQPAVLRNERAKRTRRRAQAATDAGRPETHDHSRPPE